MLCSGKGSAERMTQFAPDADWQRLNSKSFGSEIFSAYGHYLRGMRVWMCQDKYAVWYFRSELLAPKQR